jgi:manganese-dependent inorganic pyrophosphatase
MDSKEYTVAGRKLRISVLETTAPKVILDRKASLMASMDSVAKKAGADQVLLFVIDILREEATLLVPNDLVKNLAEASFGVKVSGDSVVIPGLMSRKKQIIPALKL